MQSQSTFVRSLMSSMRDRGLEQTLPEMTRTKQLGNDQESPNITPENINSNEFTPIAPRHAKLSLNGTKMEKMFGSPPKLLLFLAHSQQKLP